MANRLRRQIKRSSVRIRPWPLRWVLGQGSLLPLSQGEAFTLASISYLAILVKCTGKKNSLLLLLLLFVNYIVPFSFCLFLFSFFFNFLFFFGSFWVDCVCWVAYFKQIQIQYNTMCTVHSVLFFPKTLRDFKRLISAPIEVKFSGKTLYAILCAPIYFWMSIFSLRA